MSHTTVAVDENRPGQVRIADHLRDLADDIENGRVRVRTITADSQIVDGPPQGGFRTFKATGQYDLTLDLVKRASDVR